MSTPAAPKSPAATFEGAVYGASINKVRGMRQTKGIYVQYCASGKNNTFIFMLFFLGPRSSNHSAVGSYVTAQGSSSCRAWIHPYRTLLVTYYSSFSRLHHSRIRMRTPRRSPAVNKQHEAVGCYRTGSPCYAQLCCTVPKHQDAAPSN